MTANTSSGMEYPFISVLLPVRNEARHIATSLGAVLHQQYPPWRMEILVADGESTDATVRVIQSMPGAERVRIIPNPSRIQSAGMNAALREARGEIVVRVDGHTIIEPDYLLQCVHALTISGAQNVGGSIRPVGTTRKGRAIACAARSQFAVPGAFHVELPKDAAGRSTDTVYLGAWPRAVLERVGGFNEALAVNEDYELNHRIRAAGGRVYFSPAIRSWYYSREDYRSLVRQYFRYGRGKITAVRISPGSLHMRQLVPPLFVATLVGGAGLAVVNLEARIALAALLAVYLLLALIFGMVTTREFAPDERSSVVRTALVFPMMHLSWGVGFWLGLFVRQSVDTRIPLIAKRELARRISEPAGVRESHRGQ